MMIAGFPKLPIVLISDNDHDDHDHGPPTKTRGKTVSKSTRKTDKKTGKGPHFSF